MIIQVQKAADKHLYTYLVIWRHATGLQTDCIVVLSASCGLSDSTCMPSGPRAMSCHPCIIGPLFGPCWPTGGPLMAPT